MGKETKGTWTIGGVIIIGIAIAIGVFGAFAWFRLYFDKYSVDTVSEAMEKLNGASQFTLSGDADSVEERFYIYVGDEKLGTTYEKGFFNAEMKVLGGKEKGLIGTIAGSKEEINKDFANYVIKDDNGNVIHYMQNELVKDGRIKEDGWYYVFYNKEKEPIAYYIDDDGSGPWTIYSMEGEKIAYVDYDVSIATDIITYNVEINDPSNKIGFMDALMVLYMDNHNVVSRFYD